MPFTHVVQSEADLRTVFRRPGKPALRKQIDHLDEHCRSFLAHTPFVIIATAGADGRCDASPKGGPNGFVRVLDDHRLAIPDLAGNNRLDTMQNLLANPGVALLCCIPGIDETLRINGRGCITTDADVLAACTVEGRTPRVAIGIDVEEAYIHCNKALRRGGVWQPQTWPDTSDMPSVACMLRDHVGLDGVTAEQVSAALEENAQRTMWEMGGTDEVRTDEVRTDEVRHQSSRSGAVPTASP